MSEFVLIVWRSGLCGFRVATHAIPVPLQVMINPILKSLDLPRDILVVRSDVALEVRIGNERGDRYRCQAG